MRNLVVGANSFIGSNLISFLKNKSHVVGLYHSNKEKLDNIDYNSLYTVLEWTNYWDITHPNYFGLRNTIQ